MKFLSITNILEDVDRQFLAKRAFVTASGADMDEKVENIVDWLNEFGMQDKYSDSHSNGHHLNYLMLAAFDCNVSFVMSFNTDLSGKVYTDEQVESYLSSLDSKPVLAEDFGYKGMITTNKLLFDNQFNLGNIEHVVFDIDMYDYKINVITEAKNSVRTSNTAFDHIVNSINEYLIKDHSMSYEDLVQHSKINSNGRMKISRYILIDKECQPEIERRKGRETDTLVDNPKEVLRKKLLAIFEEVTSIKSQLYIDFCTKIKKNASIKNTSTNECVFEVNIKQSTGSIQNKSYNVKYDCRSCYGSGRMLCGGCSGTGSYKDYLGAYRTCSAGCMRGKTYCGGCNGNGYYTVNENSEVYEYETFVLTGNIEFTSKEDWNFKGDDEVPLPEFVEKIKYNYEMVGLFNW
jgi:hypothetical protein